MGRERSLKSSEVDGRELFLHARTRLAGIGPELTFTKLADAALQLPNSSHSF